MNAIVLLLIFLTVSKEDTLYDVNDTQTNSSTCALQLKEVMKKGLHRPSKLVTSTTTTTTPFSFCYINYTKTLPDICLKQNNVRHMVVVIATLAILVTLIFIALCFHCYKSRPRVIHRLFTLV